MITKLTFFSGTDQATLLELGSKQVHFYSLIVNNAGKYSAAITKRVIKNRKVEETRIVNTFGDQVIEESELEYLEEVVEDVHYHLLDIEYPFDYSEFKDRISKISKESTPSVSPMLGFSNGLIKTSKSMKYKDVHKSIYEKNTTMEELPFESFKEDLEVNNDEIKDMAKKSLAAILLGLNSPTSYLESKFNNIVDSFNNINSKLDEESLYNTLSTRVFNIIDNLINKYNYDLSEVKAILGDIDQELAYIESTREIDILGEIIYGEFNKLIEE